MVLMPFCRATRVPTCRANRFRVRVGLARSQRRVGFQLWVPMPLCRATRMPTCRRANRVGQKKGHWTSSAAASRWASARTSFASAASRVFSRVSCCTRSTSRTRSMSPRSGRAGYLDGHPRCGSWTVRRTIGGWELGSVTVVLEENVRFEVHLEFQGDIPVNFT